MPKRRIPCRMSPWPSSISRSAIAPAGDTRADAAGDSRLAERGHRAGAGEDELRRRADEGLDPRRSAADRAAHRGASRSGGPGARAGRRRRWRSSSSATSRASTTWPWPGRSRGSARRSAPGSAWCSSTCRASASSPTARPRRRLRAAQGRFWSFHDAVVTTPGFARHGPAETDCRRGRRWPGRPSTRASTATRSARSAASDQRGGATPCRPARAPGQRRLAPRPPPFLPPFEYLQAPHRGGAGPRSAVARR